MKANNGNHNGKNFHQPQVNGYRVALRLSGKDGRSSLRKVWRKISRCIGLANKGGTMKEDEKKIASFRLAEVVSLLWAAF